MIIFVIVIVIQFVVITKGATRISEVAARFALDGMPGRQMAIDADLNAGVIDEAEAQRRRQEITQQADFFGAMDGASKFVRGDAIAGIVITLINIVGGLVIGVVESGMSLSEAGSLFTKLTIGDGLVSQVPAFLISLAAGLLVTRSSHEVNLPVGVLAATVLAAAGAGRDGRVSCGADLHQSADDSAVADRRKLHRHGGDARRGRSSAKRSPADTKAKAAAKKPADERIEDYLTVDPMEIEIGVGLIRLADPKRGGDLLERIQRVRQNMAGEMGIIMPKVRIRDNMRLDQNQYRIKIADIAVAEGERRAEWLLAMDSGTTTGKLHGIATREPAFNTPATWIDAGQRDQAEMFGYTVVEPASVLATHLTEDGPPACRRDAHPRRHQALDRRAEANVAGRRRRTDPRPDEAGRSAASAANAAARAGADPPVGADSGNAGRLRPAHEGSGPADRIRPPPPGPHDLHPLSRQARTGLHVVTLDPALEDRIRAGIEHTERGLFIRMSPQAVETTCRLIATEIEKLVAANHPADRAGQPADSRRPETDDGAALAAAGRAELQRNHARHADRIGGSGRGRDRGQGTRRRGQVGHAVRANAKDCRSNGRRNRRDGTDSDALTHGRTNLSRPDDAGSVDPGAPRIGPRGGRVADARRAGRRTVPLAAGHATRRGDRLGRSQRSQPAAAAGRDSDAVQSGLDLSAPPPGLTAIAARRRP